MTIQELFNTCAQIHAQTRIAVHTMDSRDSLIFDGAFMDFPDRWWGLRVTYFNMAPSAVVIQVAAVKPIM